MSELGLDPLDLASIDVLRPKLQSILKQQVIDDRIVKVDTLNDKQLFDKLI